MSVLICHVPDFIADIEQIVSNNYPDFEICWFGHIGDGNLHLNILKPDDLSKDEFLKNAKPSIIMFFPQSKNIMVQYQPSMVWA